MSQLPLDYNRTQREINRLWAKCLPSFPHPKKGHESRLYRRYLRNVNKLELPSVSRTR